MREIDSKEVQDEFSNKLSDCKSKGHDIYTETSTGAYFPFRAGSYLGIIACCKECKWSGSIRIL